MEAIFNEWTNGKYLCIYFFINEFLEYQNSFKSILILLMNQKSFTKLKPEVLHSLIRS